MPAPISPRLEPTRRRRSQWAWLAVLSCAAVLAACAGGSGSSGFDVSAENSAIDDALASQDCTVNAGLTICPSGQSPTPPTALPSATVTPMQPAFTQTARTTPPTATGTPAPIVTATSARTPTHTPTATAIPTLGVETNVGNTDTVPCTSAGSGSPCLFEFTFQPSGFPATATYAVAYRARNPDTDWQLVPTSRFSATVLLEPGLEYQFAVLVFLNGDGHAAASVDALGLTDANFAFVTPVLTANP